MHAILDLKITENFKTVYCVSNWVDFFDAKITKKQQVIHSSLKKYCDTGLTFMLLQFSP